MEQNEKLSAEADQIFERILRIAGPRKENTPQNFLGMVSQALDSLENQLHPTTPAPPDAEAEAEAAGLREGEHLTWRELKAVSLPEHLLDEPVLFRHLDAYGTDYAYPVKLLRESLHPNEQHTLCLGEDCEELTMEYSTDNLEEGTRLIRRLLPGAPTLHFSDMDADMEDAVKWLTAPIPAPEPVVRVMQPAPLFEQPTPPQAPPRTSGSGEQV